MTLGSSNAAFHVLLSRMLRLDVWPRERLDKLLEPVLDYHLNMGCCSSSNLDLPARCTPLSTALAWQMPNPSVLARGLREILMNSRAKLLVCKCDSSWIESADAKLLVLPLTQKLRLQRSRMKPRGNTSKPVRRTHFRKLLENQRPRICSN